MKNKMKWMLGVLLVGALASCEMKDELAGTSTTSQEMGALELDLSVSEPESRADDKAANFPVKITCPDDPENTDKNKEFSSYATMENPVQLPVGDYVVSANTPGDLLPIMDNPYYKGEQKTTIAAGATDQISVVCKMANTKIRLELPEDFATFQSWTIQFNDGTSNILTFGTDADVNGDGSTAKYWYLGDTGASTITMNITATTADGVQVSQSETFKKADADESYNDDEDNFVGGDALDVIINVTEEPIDPDKPEETRPQISFDITVDATFNNTNESVTIPVTPGVSGGGTTSGGTTGGGDEEEDSPISITDNGTGYLTNGVTVVDGAYPSDVAVVMNVENGIQNLYVKIESTNATFKGLVAGMGLVDGDGMDLASESEDVDDLSKLFPLPKKNSPNYTFTMSKDLFELLGIYAGKHDFTLTVIDNNNNQKSATLTINI